MKNKVMSVLLALCAACWWLVFLLDFVDLAAGQLHMPMLVMHGLCAAGWSAAAAFQMVRSKKGK